MTAALDEFLDTLDAAYWRAVVEEARQSWLRQADVATGERNFAVAYACLDLAWESMAVEPTCVWLAATIATGARP